ncbi:ATP-binding protein [Candidatus Shapirobacteria bacterium]|nr:ATP-binding protein [Candidatus Shapirobacteria bacterium]
MNLIDRIVERNRQWKREKMSKQSYKRKIINRLWRDMEIKPMSLITGMRRVGKSVVMEQLIDQLIATGIDRWQILFFEFLPKDNQEVLEEVMDYYLKTVVDKKQKYYIFFDEIQYIKDYEEVMKEWYDKQENVKFVLTGSFSLLYKKRAKDSLAGRYLDYVMTPLNFMEYEGIKLAMADGTGDRQANFRRFLRYGRLPEIVNYSEDQAGEYLNTLKQRILTQDSFDYFEIEKPNVLGRIFDFVAINNGGIINIDSWSKDLGVSRETVSKYLEVLKIMGVVYTVSNSTDPFKVESSSKKAYVSSCFVQEKDAGNLGSLAESYTLERLLADGKLVTFYRKRDKEIDFLIPKEKRACEVKFCNKIDSVDKYVKLAKKIGYMLEMVTLDQTDLGEIKVTPAYLF